MSAPIDKSSLAGEKAKLQHALEHAGVVPPPAMPGTAIGGFVHCVNATPCRVTHIHTPAGLAERQSHPDDLAVDRFAAAMKEKMAKQRTFGRDGWDDTVGCPARRLQAMLVHHVSKGDPVDVGNFAMMLWNRGEPTALMGVDALMRNVALDEWFSKTDWVQEQGDTFPLGRLGKHRADVMREEIERLRAIVASGVNAIRALKSAAPVAQPLAPSGAVLTDAEIVQLLASLGTDCEKSRYEDNPVLQVHTTVPGVRNIIAAYLASLAAQPLAGQDVRAVTEWQLVMDEVERATRKFPTWPTDPLHAVAVLGEEFGELTKAVLQTTYEPHKVSEGELRMEAIQTAAMSLRFLASLGEYEFTKSPQHHQTAAEVADKPAGGAT